MKAIEIIEDPCARRVAHALFGLSVGESLPTFGTTEWHQLRGDLTALSLAAPGKPHFQLGTAAIAIVLQQMASDIAAEALLRGERANQPATTQAAQEKTK